MSIMGVTMAARNLELPHDSAPLLEGILRQLAIAIMGIIIVVLGMSCLFQA
jgi:hypothetical protein